MIRFLAIGLMAFILAACNTAATRDVNSFAFRIPPGSKLVLTEDIQIPTGSSHLKFQSGRMAGGVSEYETNCRFDVYDLGPSTIKADTFAITRPSSGQEWAIEPSMMRFYREIPLKSDTQKDVWKLTCQHWEDPLSGRNVTVPQMQKALGKYFSFEFTPQH